MAKILKQNWFVVLVAIVLVGFSIFSVYDTNKGKLPGKSESGKDVIASIDDVNITADDVYEKLYDAGGESLLTLKFQAAVVDEAVDMTDELEESAENIKAYLESTAQSYASSYGMSVEDYMANTLSQYGYAADEIDLFARVQAKMTHLQNEYVESHLDELFTPMHKENNGRTVSHILVKMADAKNPTDAEMATVKAIEKDLETMKFEEVAKKYADKGDTSSAQNGGYLGYMDKTTGYVKSFLDTALSLKAGERSEWVKESNSSYNGWHMIVVHETDKDKILNDEKAKDSVYSAIATANPDLTTKFIKEAADKLDIKYGNEEVEKHVADIFAGKKD